MATPSGFGAGGPPAGVPPLTVQRTAVSAIGADVDAADYAVAFRLEGPRRPEGLNPSAEHWLRNMFEGAPAPLRWFLLVGWTAITCRLRARRSSSVILGWSIEAASQDRAVIAVQAWIGFTSRLVLTLDGNAVTVASSVTYTRPTRAAARAMWAMTIPLHERILPYLLRQAAQRVQTAVAPA
jgi:hypothetical protein